MQKPTILLILAIIFTIPATSGADAQTACAAPDSFAALQISALQQRFMVAALSCGKDARNDYNAFQTRWRSALRASDRQMLQTFGRIRGAGGEAGYNRFKTKLAAKAELKRIGNSPLYCATMHQRFTDLETQRQTSGAGAPLALLQRFAGETIRAFYSWPVAACAPVTPAASDPNGDISK